MTTAQLFWIAFGVTLASLVTTLITGFTHRRRAHFWAAPTTVVLLAITIVLAERLVRDHDFPAAQMRIHLVFAKSAAALVIPVVVTGLALVRRPGWRRAHLVCVALFVLTTVAATVTGIWVFSLSTPK